MTTATEPDATPEDPRVQLKKQALSAQLRYQLFKQTEWWVPEPGWRALCAASLNGFRTVQVLGGFGGRDIEKAGTERIGVYVHLDLAPLEEGVEKRRVDDLDLSHRRNILAFLWRHANYVLGGLYWAPAVMTDPFGDPDDGCQHAMNQELEYYLDLMVNEEKRRAWFDELPLVKALKSSILDELDANTTQPPVILDPGLFGNPQPPGPVILDPGALGFSPRCPLLQ